MRLSQLPVVEIATKSGQFAVTCQGALNCAPGQFYLARALTASPTEVRVPIFPFPGPPGHVDFNIDPASTLITLQPGDEVDLLGPCGRGFALPQRPASLLLVAHNLVRLIQLLHLALARQHAVAILWPTPARLPNLPAAVEIQRGPLTPDLAQWADVIALDLPDPEPWARNARALCPLPRPTDYIQALITPFMPCGTSACLACWVETNYGKKLACVDGPVFWY